MTKMQKHIEKDCSLHIICDIVSPTLIMNYNNWINMIRFQDNKTYLT